MTELRVAVEDAKKMLTVRPSTNLLLRYEDKKERVEVTREEFEAATSHLVTQTVDITRRVIDTARAKFPGLEIDRSSWSWFLAHAHDQERADRGRVHRRKHGLRSVGRQGCGNLRAG